LKRITARALENWLNSLSHVNPDSICDNNLVTFITFHLSKHHDSC
jgi:hypothetical protein